MKLVARWQGYTMAVFTAWHRVAGVKLHHSLNHVKCHMEFLPPQIQMWPPQTAAARNAPAMHCIHFLSLEFIYDSIAPMSLKSLVIEGLLHATVHNIFVRKPNIVVTNNVVCLDTFINKVVN